jgi:hypothetical protein
VPQSSLATTSRPWFLVVVWTLGAIIAALRFVRADWFSGEQLIAGVLTLWCVYAANRARVER